MNLKKVYLLAIFTALCFTAFPLQTKAEIFSRIEKTTIKLKAPQFTNAEWQAELSRRRAKVFERMADKSMLILFSAPNKIYSNDVNFLYRQENNLFYLTNLGQGGATLVLIKNGTDKQEILFLPKVNPLFEVWNGKRYSFGDAQRISGVKTIIDANNLSEFVNSVKSKTAFVSENEKVSISNYAETIYLLSDGRFENEREYERESEFAKTLRDYRVVNAQPIFARLRLVKSPLEIKLMQHAIDITAAATERAMKTVGDADWEYEVRAEIEYIFRLNNSNYWGFPSIVAAGENATTLHYEESQSPLKKGELLLTDIGAEYKHYSADITRTFPISGKFSKEQEDIYNIVYRAQDAVAAATKPGTNLVDLNSVASESVKKDLAKLGLITAPDATFKATNGREMPQYTLWSLHFFGHWLGMNVHDVGNIRTPLESGMIFTNEPGVYIREDALQRVADTPENREFLEKIKLAFEKYKNIGVRIEDDLLVTENGVEWMSKNLARSIADIEAFMAGKSR